MLKQADVHTLVRLPTGILIRSLPLAQPSACPSHSLLPANSGLREGSEPDWQKANVLFFDRKPVQERPWSASRLWIYDLRTNLHFTLKENTLKRR